MAFSRLVADFHGANFAKMPKVAVVKAYPNDIGQPWTESITEKSDLPGSQEDQLGALGLVLNVMVL